MKILFRDYIFINYNWIMYDDELSRSVVDARRVNSSHNKGEKMDGLSNCLKKAMFGTPEHHFPKHFNIILTTLKSVKYSIYVCEVTIKMLTSFDLFYMGLP